MGLSDSIAEHLAPVVTAIAEDGERTRLAFAQAMADSLRGSRIDGALARPILAGGQLYGAGGRLVGWSVRALGGEVILDLYDGTAADPARYLGAIDLPAAGSQTKWMLPGGVSFADGLFVVASGAGTPLGAVYLGAGD